MLNNVTHRAAAVVAEGDIFDLVGDLTESGIGALTQVAVLLGIVFVIGVGVATKGKMGPIVISLLAAGIFVWGVNNITEVESTVDDTVNGATNG